MWKILSEFLMELREWWEYRPKYTRIECPACGRTRRKWVAYFEPSLFCTHKCYREHCDRAMEIVRLLEEMDGYEL